MCGNKIECLFDKSIDRIEKRRYSKGKGAERRDTIKRGDEVGGTYQVLKVLGEGGTAKVYLVIHKRTQNLFALKEILLEEEVWKGAERDYVQHLKHPGLPKIYDLFKEERGIFLVMDYISGKTLQDIKAEEKRIPERMLLGWLLELLSIMEYLHGRVPPIIHGDIKPSNLALGKDGRLMLLDFGAAFAKGRGECGWGTRKFASPEQQKQNGEMDERSDFYSIGRTFFFLADGKGSRGFKRILRQCLQESPERRFSDSREFLKAVRRLQGRGRRGCRRILFTALTALLTGSFLGEEVRRETREEEYELLLESSRKEEIVKAIALFPERERAYQKLLEFALLDEIFSKAESGQLEELLAEYEVSVSRERKLSGELCYEMGIAYWYYFEEQGGKRYGKSWFKRARERTLEREKQKRAEIYERLGSYYEQKAKGERTGEGNFSWKEFLRTAEEICRVWKQQEVFGEPAKRMQEELLGQMYEGLPSMKKQGISFEEIEAVLEKVETLYPNGQEEVFYLLKESLEVQYKREEESG